MIVAIHQPNYLPWLGFFHKMALSDVFVLLDDVQFPRNKGFCSRVRIKRADGPYLLSIPVKEKRALRKISEIEIANEVYWNWQHWKTIEFSYKKAPFFSQYAGIFKAVYLKRWEKLIDINVTFIKLIKDALNIKTKLIFSSEISDSGLKGNEKIFSILKALNADAYISGEGKGAARYIKPEEFSKNDIKLIYQDFKHPVYKQLFGDFIQGLSIIDLLLNCSGKNTDHLFSPKIKQK